jgi:hypothetical protein
MRQSKTGVLHADRDTGFACYCKLWDARSGAALQTLQMDALVATLSFSSDGTYLETNRGWLHSTFLSENAAVPCLISPASVLVKGRWVSHDIKDVLWLPSEYAPSRVAVHGSRLVLGVHRVECCSWNLISEITLNRLPTHLRYRGMPFIHA